MEDPFTLAPMELTPINSTLAFNLIDDLDINDRYWLQEADQDYSIFQQPISNLFSLDISSNCIFTSSENEDSPHDILLYPQKEEISDIQSHDGEVIHDNHDDDYFCQIGSIPWLVAPDNANKSTSFSVKKKLKLAFESLKKSKIDGDILIQTWMPVKKGGKCMLTANNEAFYLSPSCHSLAYYREISKGFQFAAAEEEEEKNKKGIDFVSRVFENKLPDWTPDVKFFREDEYLRITYAQQVNICGSLVLPVFKRDETSCLGVIEIVTTTQKVNFHQEIEIVSKALKAVDLKSYDVLCPPMGKACEDDPYQAALAEIKEILKFVCNEHNLPLAQTWAPCIQHGKSGIRHSEENYLQCLSTIDSACYIPHPQLLGFHEACSEHHLLIGEGLAGEALVTNQPCFSSDISAFSTKEYPLSHHARLFGLRASIAVRLRSVYTGSDADFVLEFILPFDCEDTQEQKQLLDSLSFSIQKVCQSLRVVTDQELLSEETRLQRESISPYSPCVDTQNFGYANETEPQREMKPIIVPLGYLQEEPEGMEFKLTTHWDEDDETKLTREDHFFNNFAVKSSVEYDGDGYCKSGGRKRRTKSEKTISLQVLRPYFAGSLKDAAKSIGVCPTTLKRICRQHGITRWPSRKIKKVEHSLRKLQHVIDSVQGVEHSFQLSSLYNSINSNNTNLKQNSTKFNDQLKRQQFTTQIPDERLLKNNLTCQVRIELPTAPPQQVHVGKIMKLKVTFGEEKIRFSMQQHWQFKELRNEIAKRFNIEEYCNSNRIEIKYLDDDLEWVLLECDADLDECLEVHNSCGSSMIKLIVHQSF